MSTRERLPPLPRGVGVTFPGPSVPEGNLIAQKVYQLERQLDEVQSEVTKLREWKLLQEGIAVGEEKARSAGLAHATLKAQQGATSAASKQAWWAGAGVVVGVFLAIIGWLLAKK